jgi:exodeoxyribonuclease VII small subunit
LKKPEQIMAKEKISYDAAVKEIETILEKIEDGELGVDELTGKVSRVTELLKLCRDRLYRTESRIEEILDES